jgi:hypothetical protein
MMGWYDKEQATPFDDKPILGLRFLDGNLLAQRIRQDWTIGQKYPEIVFPSGEHCDIWESSNPEAWGIVHIAGEMDLPFKDTRDRAYVQARDIAEQVGYMVRRVGENGLEFYGFGEDENFLIVYDNQAGQMKDVIRITPQLDLVVVGIIGSIDTTPTLPERPLRMELLPDEIRARLPKLYSNEELGLEAPAQVKFFTPDSNWTWYASEFDGEDTFFGLVIGFEIELGEFSLSELESVSGPLGLLIERDKYFEPKTLRELRDQHRRERGEC